MIQPGLWKNAFLSVAELFYDTQWDESPFNFIPQGGGDHYLNHRCPGEWIVLRLMRVALDFLTREIHYDVPAQDLRINPSRLPALPNSRFTIAHVRMSGADARPQIKSAQIV